MITFILGNGFDKNCGLNTCYKDMYPFYCEIKEEDNNNIIRFKNAINKDIGNWSDFEVAMAKYAKEVSNEEEFIECYEDFCMFLENFILNEEKKFNRICDESNGIMKSLINKEFKNTISQFYLGLTENIKYEVHNLCNPISVPINFLTFNYTNTIELITSMQHEIYVGSIYHIHGRLKNGIALGMDNINQVNSTKYQISDTFCSYFIKPEFNKAYDVFRETNAKKVIDGSSIICIYGASLGESDLTWSKYVIEWLEKNEKNILFIYDYRYINKTFKTDTTRRIFSESLTVDFLKDHHVDVDKIEILKRRVHVMIGKNIFNFGDVIKDYTKNKPKVIVNKAY